MSRGARPDGGDERGLTMIEMVVALGLLAMLCVGCFQTMSVFLGAEDEGIGFGQAQQKANLALNQIRNEVRSADVVFSPAGSTGAGTNPDSTSIPSGFSLLVYTQVNGNPECVQWRLLDTGQLETRIFSNNWQADGRVSVWDVMATNVTNYRGSITPFVLDGGSDYGGSSGSGASRLLDVELVVTGTNNQDLATTLQTSVTARDVEFFPLTSTACSPVPSP